MTSILNRTDRFPELTQEQRKLIVGCEQTAHECAFEVLAGTREFLEGEKAVAAAVVGLVTALGRTIAESFAPEIVLEMVQMVLPRETAHWVRAKDKSEAA